MPLNGPGSLHPAQAGPPPRTTMGLKHRFNLAAAALCCFRAAGSLRDKRVLIEYMLKNLLRRFGFRTHIAERLAVQLDGLQVWFRPCQGELYLYKEIIADQAYERLPAFRVRPGWCVFDVGANIGVFTLNAAGKRRCHRVYAIEPDPETFARLLKNLQSNALGNVVAIQKAAGKGPAITPFARGPASTLGHLCPSAAQATGSELVVEVVTLASVIQQHRIRVVNLLKLDVEGAEADVLRGAEPELHRIERIVMEYHSAELLEECDRILRRHHFRKVLVAPPSCAYFLGASVAS